MAGAERIFFDEAGVPLGRIALTDVREIFGDAEFGGIMPIIDPEAVETGMRFTDVAPDKRVLEFDIWKDAEGIERTRHLRIEVGEQSGKVAVEQFDYALDKNGDYYLPGPGRLLEPEIQPVASNEAFLRAATEGPEGYTAY